MPIRIKLGLLLALILSLCCLIIWYLKPDQNKIPVVEQDAFNKVVSESKIQSAEIVRSDQRVTPLSHLEEQRDMLYAEFGQLSFEMIEGKKPDLRRVSEMLKQHQSLVDAGVITREDAENYLHFLKRVFPEMESELDFYLLALAKNNPNSS